MQDDTILFLAVEQSSDIDLICLYINRDHWTDIAGRVVDRVEGGSMSTRQRSFVAWD